MADWGARYIAALLILNMPYKKAHPPNSLVYRNTTSLLRCHIFAIQLEHSPHLKSALSSASMSCNIVKSLQYYRPQAPVPLSIFRSNSKFDENSECSSFEYTRPITTIFCTRHDSDTVVTCAKYRCDWPRIFYTRVFWIFIEFRIRSKYA